jgi:predicted ATPase/DNA-binding SARP family transcriptional activator
MLLQLFGTFAAQVDGRPLPPQRSRKGDWLLALLALQRGGEMDRASLAGLLWPESAHTQALYNLRRTLTELREMLGSEAWRLTSPHPHTLALDLTGAQVDVLAFDAALARGDEASLQNAVELYRGPLLEECAEEFILQERLPREQAYLETLETLAGHAAARGDHAAAIRRLRQAVALDPFRETAQQALLKALVASGDLTASLLAYRDFCLRLHQEIHAEPSLETKALFHQLRAEARRRGQASVGGTHAAGPRPAQRGDEAGADRVRPTGLTPHASRLTPPSAPRRLPRPLSQFVGRETALHAVEACLETARLVTLTGPGGVGKTRLAIQVADAIADHHRDGVWFVDLSRLFEPALVPQAVAAVLAVQGQADRPLTETLGELLRSKQLMLVLDNCEHLLSACAELVEALLSNSPDLRVLATSRQTLGLTGEVAWQLPGMSVPPQALETAGAAPEALLQFEAVRLFVERGRGATSAFSLTKRNARAVAEVCRRLDGMPLAIELAAARLKALSVEEIAARLDDRFHLLTSGSRTALPRQQTLRATMDWSYELLSPEERILLRRLSVFAGSFPMKAVEGVCTDVEDDKGRNDAESPTSPITPEAVLDLLTRLVDRSLVVVERSDDSRHATVENDAPSGRPACRLSPVARNTDTRYRLLETIRQYALERLRDMSPRSEESEEERLRRRHQEFYLRLAEEAAPYLGGPEQAGWLDAEIGNLRAALDWALERAPERALCLANALAGFWIQHGYREEGRQRLAAALDRAGPARHSPVGAWALTHLAHLAYLREDYRAARGLFAESLAVQRQLGDQRGSASILEGLGRVARLQKEYAEARALHEESLSIRRALGDRQGIAESLIGLGDTLREQGDDPSTWGRFYEEALAIRRELGDRPGMADALGHLANVAWWQGDYAQARRHREESLALWRATGSRIGVIHALGALGHLARDQGEYEDARAFYAESLLLRSELGDTYTVIQSLEDFAELAAAERQWARMTRLLGAAEAQREAMRIPLRPPEGTGYDRLLSSAREALGKEDVAAAWEAGQAMSLEQATAFALETSLSTPSVPASPTGRTT